MNKTIPTSEDVLTFLNSVENEQRKMDSLELLEIIKNLTQESPVMWGKSIVGFGKYHYKYESGREGDFFLAGFSPRKQSLTIYCMGGFGNDLMERLGKYKTGKSCLYVKKLSDVNMDILKELIVLSVQRTKEKYPD